MLQVLRSEIKYQIPLHEYYYLKEKLSRVMLEDSHNGEDGYLIRSLYYDTFYDKDLYEKLDGLEVRRKLRLRCYDPKTGGAKLEIKQKQGSVQRKRSLSMDRSSAMALNAGQTEVLLSNPDPFALECYGLIHTQFYQPKTIVEYRRTAFIARENDIRLTFDRNITATEANTDLFDENLCLHPVFDPFHVVLEVKFNGFIPSYIKDLIRAANVSPLSVGKYVLGRE